MGQYETEALHIHRQTKADVYILHTLYHSIHISVKVLYIYNIQPQARILWKFCKETAEHEYYYYNIYYNNMLINSEIQTVGATAAKTHIHICRCHSDTKSLAWVLERLPSNIFLNISM